MGQVVSPMVGRQMIKLLKYRVCAANSPSCTCASVPTKTSINPAHKSTTVRRSEQKNFTMRSIIVFHGLNEFDEGFFLAGGGGGVAHQFVKPRRSVAGQDHANEAGFFAIFYAVHVN